MIRTPRLELRNATVEQLHAEIAGREAFATALGAEVPENWPPELYGEHGSAPALWVLERMAEVPPEHRVFFQYYFVAIAPGAAPTLVGVGGFKGPPEHGTVELGYELLEQYRRRGYATEATAGMLSFAFGHEQILMVSAQTLPHLVPSIGVLEKTGFRFEGRGDEEGVIRYVITREEWQRRQPTVGNVADKLSLIDRHWTPKLIARVNDTDVKLVRIQGEFVWHHHEREDELFLVLHGRLLMQFRDREQWLGAGEFILVPRGVEHRPVAPEEVHVMLIEPAGTLNTGNVTNERTVAIVESI